MNLQASLGLRGAFPDDAGAADRALVTVPLCAPQPVARSTANRPQHILAGYSSTRVIMEFMRWAVELQQFPTVAAIISRFGVSRATAYRWRNELGETYGLQQLPPNEDAHLRCGRRAPVDGARP